MSDDRDGIDNVLDLVPKLAEKKAKEQDEPIAEILFIGDPDFLEELLKGMTPLEDNDHDK